LKGIPIVLTSGKTESVQHFEAHKRFPTHADEYLPKPFSPEQLSGVLRTLFGENGETTNGEAADVLTVDDADVADADEAEVVIEDVADSDLEALEVETAGDGEPSPITGQVDAAIGGVIELDEGTGEPE